MRKSVSATDLLKISIPVPAIDPANIAESIPPTDQVQHGPIDSSTLDDAFAQLGHVIREFELGQRPGGCDGAGRCRSRRRHPPPTKEVSAGQAGRRW
jgi:hypothetical protein